MPDLFSSTLALLSEWWWLILILVASFMFAAGNYIDELLIDTYEQPIGVLVIISGLFGLVIAAVFGGLALATNVSIFIGTALIWQSIAIGALELLWVIPYLYATKRRGAIVAGPLFQLVPVVAFGLEALTGVVPPMVQIIGSLVLIAGGILLAIETDEDEDGATRFSFDWITSGLMLISIILIAAIYVLFKDVGLQVGYLAVGFWSGVGMVLMVGVVWLVWRPYRREFHAFVRYHADGRAVAIQLFNELMDTGGAYFTHLANLIGPSVMVVTAFNATQPLFILLIGLALSSWGWMKREPLGRGRWFMIVLGIGLIIAGTALVAFGS